MKSYREIVKESASAAYIKSLTDASKKVESPKKPFKVSDAIIRSLENTKLGLVIDTDFETCGASQSISYELMLKTGAKVHGFGLADKVSGVSKETENLTPSGSEIKEKIKLILQQSKF